MTNLKNYTRQFTLKEVLRALGLLSFQNEEIESPKVGVGFLKYKKEFEMNDFKLNFELCSNFAFMVIKNAIAKDLKVYVAGIDAKAKIKSASSYIRVMLSKEETLGYNMSRIFTFLKRREKRYARLINYAEPIKQLISEKDKNIKLSLRLNSINEIPKANTLQFNRLLDDIIENLAQLSSIQK